MSLDGKGSHITFSFIFGGYKINGGNYSGLTILQKAAINIIMMESVRFSKENKLIGDFDFSREKKVR